MLTPVNPTIAVLTPAGAGHVLLVSHDPEETEIYLIVSIIGTEELIWFNTEEVLLPQYFVIRFSTPRITSIFIYA